MRVAYFTHSLRSCWNHGNAHFVRGILSELAAQGHEVSAYEPESSWSLTNLLKDHGPAGLEPFCRAYPALTSRTYERPEEGAAHALSADLVIVHEWNDPELVAAVGRLRARGGRFTLLFHDTHHRAVSAPEQMRAFDLNAYDGVLAFGATLGVGETVPSSGMRLPMHDVSGPCSPIASAKVSSGSVTGVTKSAATSSPNISLGRQKTLSCRWTSTAFDTHPKR
jgi:spore maturation protein CgeB